MSDVNKCIFIGRLGRDPEIKTFGDGGKIANFSLATSKTWKDKQTGEKKEKTTWVPIVARGGLATVVESYVSKGSQLFIEGEFTVRDYTNKDGQKVYVTEIVASELKMLGERKSQHGSASRASNQSANEPSSSEDDLDDSDLPF